MNTNGGRRDADTKSMIVSASLMSEKTHLPDLDYRALQIDRLKRIAEAKGPEGRYAPLAQYLSQRGSQVNAAEIDRRMRTWFEDLISKIVADPAAWDKDQTLNGRGLMDYLAGVQAPAQEQQPEPNKL